MAAPNNESVQYNLLLNAQQALKELQAFNKAAISSAGAVDSLEARIRNFERVVAAEAKKAGVAFEQALASFEKLDAKMKSSKKGGIIGTAKGVDIFEETKILHSRNVAYEEQQRMAKAAFEQTNKQRNVEIDQLTNATEAHKKAGGAAQEAGRKGEEGSRKATLATRAWGIAVGMLIHQGINLLINAFQQMFTMAISGLRELETATYNLVNAERTLSEQGVEITPKGLDETIKKLQELDPLLSRAQATEVVSRVSSLVAPNVGFNAKEVEQFSQAVAILAVKNRGLGKSFEEVESQMSNAFLSGKVSVGINQLGVKITDQIVKDEALRMGLVKNAEEFDNLTGKMEANIKARAMLSVVVQSTNKEIAHLPEFFKTADAKFGIFQARMADFFSRIGEVAAPILIAVFDTLIEGLEKASAWIDKNREALGVMANAAAALTPIVLKVLGFVLKVLAGTAQLFVGMAQGIQLLINKIPFLKKLVDLLSKITPQTNTSIAGASDTPTGTPDASLFGSAKPSSNQDAEALKEAEDKLADIMQEARDKRLDIERDYQQKLQDINLNYSQKLQDIALNTADKTADAQRDYADKIADINKDTEQKKQDARAEAHKKEVDAETKYQDELKKLKEKYLMDLEDALHDRDARQILRIMRQYQIDKNALAENRQKEKQEAQADLAQKIQQAEAERKEKTEQAKRDLATKLRDIKIAADRERRDAAINHNRQLQDAAIAHRRALEEHRIYLQRKLRDLAEALQQEYNLTAAGQQAINNLLSSGYASASSPASINAGTYQAPASSTYTSSTPTTSSTWAQAGMYGTTGLAEGGTFLATRPATINVAENRPEMITATPLGKPGRDISKVFTNGGGGMGGSGQIEIAMTLSPDLEARIVSNTLNETANIVTRINRSKS